MGFQCVFRNCKIAVFRARKIAEKDILLAFQSVGILHLLEKQRQLVDDKLALTTDLFEIKEKAGEQKCFCLTVLQQRFQSFGQLHDVAVVLLIY